MLSAVRVSLGLLFLFSSFSFGANQIIPLTEARKKLEIPNYTAADRQRLADQALLMLKDLFVHRSVKIKDFGEAADPVPKMLEIQKKAKDLSNEELHKSIAQVFSDLHDLHTNYYAPAPLSCGATFVPLSFASVKDGDKQVILVSRFLKLHPELVEGITVGDELLEIDGVAVDKVIEQLTAVSGGSNHDAMQARATQMLSMRNLSTQPIPEKDSIELTFNGKDGQYKKVIPWYAFLSEQCMNARNWSPTNPFRWHLLNMAEDDYQKKYNRIFGNPALVEPDRTWGTTNNFKDIFEMALLDTPAGKIGYVQLKAFYWDDKSLDAATVIEAFRNDIETHLSEGIGLVIDVRGNPGGLINLSEKLVQLFSPKEVDPTKVRMLANPLNERIFLKANGTENRWSAAIQTAIKSGNEYTAPMAITPVREANSVGQVWFRPVVVLTDATCFSACDLFASLMQDTGAATIIGLHKTTGAGGANVMEHKTFKAIMGPLNNPFETLPFGQNMRVAWRQTIRSGKHQGKILEDQGVESDIVVPLKKGDIGSGPKDLMKQIHKIIDELQPGFTSGLSVRKGADVLLKNGAVANWKEKVYGIDSIDIFVEGKLIKTVSLDRSTEPKEVEITVDSLSGNWIDRPVLLVGKKGGDSVFRTVRELLWRGEYTDIPAKGLEIGFADGKMDPFHAVSLRGAPGSGWQIVDDKTDRPKPNCFLGFCWGETQGKFLRVGKGPLYESNVLTRAFLPIKLNGKGGQFTLDISLEAESSSDSLRFYIQNPDTGERYNVYAGSAISKQKGISIPLPAGWDRADVVFEFESDENWNMAGPILSNFKVTN